jgi:hypothetical protein
VSVRSTGILVSAATALVLLAYANRTLSPTTAEALTSQEHRKPSGERTRSASRTPHPERSPGAADHPPVDQYASPAGSWSAAEIIGALEECNLLLAPLGAAFDISKPIRTAQCGAPAPILLRRVAGVEITPPTIVNCRVAAKLHEWIETKLQPLAESVLGGGITRIVSASGYSCRQRFGNTSGKQSEHSYANAFDVAAFTTKDDRTIDFLSAWGPTVRDLRAQAQEPAQADIAGGDARPLTDAGEEAKAQKSLFLRKVHESACGIFTTVLGPEANEAHRNHLHLDLAQRRSSAFCE